MQDEVKLEKLRRGDRFFMLLETTGRRIYGTVLSISSGSATVKIDPRGEGRGFARLNKLTGEYDTVRIPPRPVIEHWSLATPVYRVAPEAVAPEHEQLALGVYPADSSSADSSNSAGNIIA